MKANVQLTLEHFEAALYAAGYDVKLDYNPLAEEVVVEFANGYKKHVNVASDSALAMMKDILRQAFAY
jgi:hypothetical protein